MHEVVWIIANLVSIKHKEYLDKMLGHDTQIIEFLSETVSMHPSVAILDSALHALNNICDEDK